MKIRIYLKLIIIILLLVNTTVKAANISELETEADVETSIVLLEIRAEEKTVATDPFFELFVLTNSETEDSYVLLPLNLLSSYFELGVNFQRINNLIIVSNPKTGAEVKIDLAARKYLEHEEWAAEAPVVFAGDFFVSASVLEYLFDVQVEWNSSYQELIISGDYFIPESATEKAESIKRKRDKREVGEKQNVITNESNHSLGSIQYKGELDYHHNKEGLNNLINQNTLNLHGRWRNWAVSGGIETRFDFDDHLQEYSLELIKAEYNEDDQLIILGDTEFDFVNTMGAKDLRGFYYRQPEKQSNKKLAYTSITGPAEQGAEVTLYVNGDEYKTIQVGADEIYLFNRIYLRRKRLNILRVVIELPTGESRELIKQVAGSTKIYEPGTEEVELIAGFYQEEGYNNWEGRAVGIKTSAADEKVTFKWETILNQEFESPTEDVMSNMDLGIAFRLGSRTVVDSDFLTVNGEYETAAGIQSETTYSLESGYLAGSYFYIPYQIHLLTPRNEGKGGQLTGEWELAPKWNVNSLIGTRYAEVASDSNQLYEGELSFNYQDSWRSSKAIVGRVEKTFFNRDPFIDNVNRQGLILAASKTEEGARREGELQLFNNVVNWEQGPVSRYNDFNLETEIYKKLSDTFLVTNSLETSGDIYDREVSNLILDTKSKLKWSPRRDTFISFGQELEGEEEKNNFTKQRTKLGIDITQYLSRNSILNLGLSNNKSETSMDYNLYSLRLTKFWPDKEGEISASLNRLVPQEDNLRQQNTFQIEGERMLADEKRLNISLGNTYNGVSSEVPDYFIRFSVAQAFGFAGDLIVPQEFRNNQHTSFVTGYVYLDENNNQIKDEGEPIIPGIKMKLDNLLAETDDKGQFRFNLTRPGEYSLNFDFNSLWADYTPVTKEKIIKVSKNENMVLNYGLTINGSISGTAFIDNNANGQLDEGEEPLSWLGFSINDGAKTIYTDTRGEFYLENMPLGEHKLTILPDSLPAQMKPAQGLIYKATIKQNKLDVRDLLIPIVYDFGGE